jgi:competence protein ComEC
MPDFRGLLLIAVAGGWLAGIVLASFLQAELPPPLVLLLLAGAAFLCIFPFSHDPSARLILLLSGCLLLGASRYALSLPRNAPHAISAFISTQRVTVRGTISEQPKLEGRHLAFLVDVNAISIGNTSAWQNADGRIELLTPGTILDNPYSPQYGDTIEAGGKLQAPPASSSPDILASMTFPSIQITNSGGNPILVFLGHLRITLATILTRALPQPEAALLIALLLSLHTPALTPLITVFNVTGTAHLIAPSGFKVTILAGIVQRQTQWLRRKQQAKQSIRRPQHTWGSWLATALVLSSVAVYTLLSGAGPAALRAGIMGMLLLLAPRIGRTYNVYTALAATALLLSLINPFILWDTGFLLSFLGTLGIVLLTPTMQRLLHPLARLPFGHVLVEIIAVTLAAQVATLPIFAIAFKQVSFIAPIANLLTVPLLTTFLSVGLLVCCAGLLSPLLALLCGWIAWPLLWYLITVISWCAALPGAYITVDNISNGIAWGYYGLLTLLVSYLLFKEHKGSTSQATVTPHEQAAGQPAYLSRRFLLLLQTIAAAIIVLATGTVALAAPSESRLSISFFAVAPAGQPAQGEAILVRTPDDKTILIDGGLDPTVLALSLDAQLPSWQRFLDLVILTSTRPDHLTGLQDVVNRYQIGEVVDAGMLHPNANYALLRRTLTERAIHYTPVAQGATITVGTSLLLQVLWPATLHKSSNEERDNSLILRLVTPTLRLLLLGDATYSPYALKGLVENVGKVSNSLQVGIVQIVGEEGKAFPPELTQVLQIAQPSLVLVTPEALSSVQRKRVGASTTLPLATFAALSLAPTVQVVQIAQVGSVELHSEQAGWNVQPL